ncbi:hypothetical protein [Bacillus sp. MRMR6]|uniref:hypothetical protein n=1 Tax=Bacillus sp. MRMR6 TaxID=1928617 RepID=UPI00095314C9|nr:hypothetical protein [Bacillus sp. MRMR6]OLS39113.1 hypothetical protein BTR25_13345 [Bacillus sp. MRMR6]
MGVLLKAMNLKKNMKQQIVLERLKELGVTHSQQGKVIEELDYNELKFELVIAEMNQVDIEHPDHKWFR